MKNRTCLSLALVLASLAACDDSQDRYGKTAKGDIILKEDKERLEPPDTANPERGAEDEP